MNSLQMKIFQYLKFHTIKMDKKLIGKATKFLKDHGKSKNYSILENFK